MGGKVIHVSDEFHARVRAHCEKLRISMRCWVEQQLELAMTQPIEQKRSQTPTSAVMPVAKKRLPDVEAETGDEPWARPPFWAGRKQRSA